VKRARTPRKAELQQATTPGELNVFWILIAAVIKKSSRNNALSA
jgi:hypothetical protein